MQTRVDPTILGGVIARVGDQVIDGSVRYRLSALQHQLLTNVSTAQIDRFSDDLTQAMDNGQSSNTAVSQPTSPSQAQV